MTPSPLLTLTVVPEDIVQFDADVLVVNLFEGVLKPGGATAAVDKALKGAITRELEVSERFSGKLGETFIIHTHQLLCARYVVLVGLGKAKDLNSQALRRASAAAIRACMRLKIETVATILHGAGIGGFNPSEAARLLTEGVLLGSYRFTKHKTRSNALSDSGSTPVSPEGDADGKPPKTPVEIQTVTIVEQDENKIDAIQEGIRWGGVIARNVNTARDWVFDSPNHITPTFLRDQAKAIKGLQCKILEMKDIQKLGMGAFHLVARGSDEPPFLIHLSYKPKSPRKRVAIVGKGITFDSGGLSLKPAKSMELMKMDMAGAAAALCTIRAIAELGQLDIQVDVFVPTCENMPSAHSSRPGDIVTSMKGKTIEVNNTDAEGRLILCDALTYAQKEVQPDEIIDLATLTGACVVALGKVASGILGTGQDLIDKLREAGDKAGEKYWQLPLYDEYKDALKSDVADLINAGSGGEAGTSAAGMFLKEFIEDNRAWAHLDIAGPAYTSKDLPEVPKGATGVGVRTLLYYLYGL